MNDAQNDAMLAIAGAVLPLLQAMDAMTWTRQRLDPDVLDQLYDAVKDFAAPLEAGLPAFHAADWPDGLAEFRDGVAAAAAAELKCYREFTAVAGVEGFDALKVARRALRSHLDAERALYPLATFSPPISQYFLPGELREDQALLDRLDDAAETAPGRGGVLTRPGPNGDARGGFACYLPEYLDPMTPAPVVLALHGGRGNGPDYLWSWLPAARAHGAVLIAPTALGETWAIMGEDVDSPNLNAILDAVDDLQALDRSQILMTGMSDGGTFSYVSGLMEDTPSRALAPFAASFHPMLLEFVADKRVKDLPIRLAHGARDWMFSVDVARQAAEALQGKGAAVTYRELPDRAHVFPQDEANPTLEWFLSL